MALSTASVHAKRSHHAAISATGIRLAPITKHLQEPLLRAEVQLGFGARAEEVKEHVAHAVLFLASDKSRYATGSQYVLDAGLLSR